MNKNGSSWIRKDRRLAIYIRDRFTCCYCGRDLRHAEPREVTLDHLVPRSAGGNNETNNLVLACLSCNSSRGDRPWIDFAPGGAADRIMTQRALPINLPLARALIAGTAGDAEIEAAR